MCSADSFGTPKSPKSVVSVLILLTWLSVVSVVATQHELWRDEVRALLIALEPASVWQLPALLKYEGHPLLWYLILRGAFWVTQTPVVLQVVSICIAFASVVIFYTRAPFPVWQKILFMWGVLPAYEYCIASRNYGISMLLFFLFATVYSHKTVLHKKNIFILAGVLIALAHTNVHSCLLAGVLTGVWLWDVTIVQRRELHFRDMGVFVCALVAIGLGMLASIATILPPHDTILTQALSLDSVQILEAVYANILHPGLHFGRVLPYMPDTMRDVVLWGLIAGLLIRPHIALALFVGLVVVGTFFSVVYEGKLRHQGIFLVFMLTLYWIVYPSITPTTAPLSRRRQQPLQLLYHACVYIVLPAILAIQLIGAVNKISEDLRREKSSNKAFASFLIAHAEYRNAIILGEPDYALESLPYYAPNRIYIPREDRFGKRVTWTTVSKTRLSLGELLHTAQQLNKTHRVPVLIALGHLALLHQPCQQPAEIAYSYNKTFTWSCQELTTFHSHTTPVASFTDASGDENYAIYRLDETDDRKPPEEISLGITR